MEEKYYFDNTLFSTEDYKEAAKDLLDKSINDFESIKNRKWYEKFFSAINVGNGDKKIIISQIKNIEDFFKLFLAVYDQDLKLQDDQLDRIVSELLENRKDVEKIYELTVLGINRENDIRELLDDRSKYILLLILSKASSFYESNSKLSDYNKCLADYLLIDFVQVELTDSQLEELRHPEIAYRCLAEQKAICGVDDFPQGVFDIVDGLAVSEKSKRKIDEQVSEESRSFSPDYFISKYAKKIIIEAKISASANEDEKMANKRRIGSSLDENEIQCVEMIESLIHVMPNEILTYKSKHLIISGTIQCDGKIHFEDCIIENDTVKKTGAIILSKDASISIVNSIIKCEGCDNTETPSFINCTRDNELIIENSTFNNCVNLIGYKDNIHFWDCKRVHVTECRIFNCLANFISIDANDFSINDSIFTYNTDLKYDENEEYSPINTRFAVLNNCMFLTEIMLNKFCKGFFGEFASALTFNKCTFVGKMGKIAGLEFNNCYFKDTDSITVHGSVNSCLFEECKPNGALLFLAHKVCDCIFYNCSGRLIFAYNPLIVDSCKFINIDNNRKLGDENHTNQAMISIIKDKAHKDTKKQLSKVSNSHFLNVFMDGYYLIDASSDYCDLVCVLDNCSFEKCYTSVKSGKLILETTNGFTNTVNFIFDRKKEYKAISIKNCIGLDNVAKTESKPVFSKKVIEIDRNQYGCTRLLKEYISVYKD